MIKIVQGNLLNAIEDMVGHQVNCQGVWGKTGGNDNIAKQMREKYPEAYEDYSEYCHRRTREQLIGSRWYTRVNDGKIIADIFGQDNYGNDGTLFTNYAALKTSLRMIHSDLTNPGCIYYGKTLALPFNLGCGRGGGKWEIVYSIIDDVFHDYDVTLYKL